MKKLLLYIVIMGVATNSLGADPPKKAQMKLLGIFDAGQPGASIVKLYDQTDDVVCYVLTPDITTRKQVDQGKFAYEGNSIGSISCLKVKLPVISLNQQPTK